MKPDNNTTELKQIQKIKDVRNNLRDLYELAPSVHILSASTLLGRYKDMLENTRPPTQKSSDGLVEAKDRITNLKAFIEDNIDAYHEYYICRELDDVLKDLIILSITTTTETASEGEKWISVEDRLPECSNRSSDHVLVYGKYDYCIALLNKYGGDKFQWVKTEYMQEVIISDITHWQPLPAPPTQDNEGKG